MEITINLENRKLAEIYQHKNPIKLETVQIIMLCGTLSRITDCYTRG
jgi:hypothetical protein